MNIDTHCSDCGAITRRETQDDGTEVSVCTNDDCYTIIVGVLSVPSGGGKSLLSPPWHPSGGDRS